MAAEDHLPPDWEAHYSEHTVTCKVCGVHGLKWEMTRAGWRLFLDGRPHECIDPFKIANDMRRKKKRATRHI